jgi:Xaa-Pro aminopeptidase
MTFADRRERILASLPDDLSALLVTTPANVRYLTGFTGSNGQVLLAAEPVFFNANCSHALPPAPATTVAATGHRAAASDSRCAIRIHWCLTKASLRDHPSSSPDK